MNFVEFIPKKGHLIMLFKIPQTNERDELIDESTLEPMKYDSSWKYYRIRIGTALTDAESQIVKSLVQQAYREYTGLDHAPGV